MVASLWDSIMDKSFIYFCICSESIQRRAILQPALALISRQHPQLGSPESSSSRRRKTSLPGTSPVRSWISQGIRDGNLDGARVPVSDS